jgi:hypothetical protein
MLPRCDVRPEPDFSDNFLFVMDCWNYAAPGLDGPFSARGRPESNPI